MMVMGLGYFRSGNRSPTAKRKAKTKKNEEEGDGLRETLLEQQPGAEGGSGVPKGFFAVYVGEESRRFVVPTGYLREPAFRDLMERSADEFGFAQAGGLHVPCAEEDFEDLQRKSKKAAIVRL